MNTELSRQLRKTSTMDFLLSTIETRNCASQSESNPENMFNMPDKSKECDAFVQTPPSRAITF
jgi:hypothetical protein